MLTHTRNRMLAKYLLMASQSHSASPAEVATSSGVSRVDYEEFLVQKLFFKNGGIYLKVFNSPTELRPEIDRIIKEGLVSQDAAGRLTLSPAGVAYLSLTHGFLQLGYFILLALMVAALGFAGGIGINYSIEQRIPAPTPVVSSPTIPKISTASTSEPRYRYGEGTIDERTLWYITGQDKPNPKINFEEIKKELLVK